MSYLPIVKSHLPSNLNPNRFKDTLNVYCDGHEDRYSLEWGEWEFLIENKVPFTIYVTEGINGKELYDRRVVLRLLRIAQRVHLDTGSWPRLSTEWAEMCPGGLVKLDITALAAISNSAPKLPDILQTVSSRLDNVLDSPDSPFAEAEKVYAKVLKALPSFDDALQTVQREFDEHPLCVLNANTKSRRLRFIGVLAQLADGGTDSQRLANATLKWASEHVTALQAYSDPKGAILASTGLRSVRPYLELAKELEIVTTVGRGVALTNTGRALVLLAPQQHSFSLSLEERLYFLHDLLVHDRDVVWPLLVHMRNRKLKKREVRKAFPDVYQQYLGKLRDYCGTVRSRRQLDDALERIKRWQNPDVYMEHVVDPRISWFVDLHLCQLDRDEVSLTEKGVRLASTFVEPCEEEVVPVTKEFLRRRFFKIYAPCLMDEPSEDTVQTSREQLSSMLNECCEFVAQHTKSLAPNRIVASTLLRYAGVRLYAQHRLVADFSDLISFLSDETKPHAVPWRFRWQPAQDDGYLTRIAGSNTHSNYGLRQTETKG